MDIKDRQVRTDDTVNSLMLGGIYLAKFATIFKSQK